jgi:2',3'-cyclic-nucleotide 2'-phosphodiesterase (5'-nucleotidase family)
MNNYIYSVICSVVVFAITNAKLPLNISPYSYPHPEPKGSEQYTIAIFATNDFHGYALPRKFYDNRSVNRTYMNGSVEILSTVIDAVKDEWKERFMWLDGGDHGSGGFEYLVSNGKIMSDFFNFKNLTASALGNHEFNFGLEFLFGQMRNSTFDYLVANVRDKKTQSRTFMPNQHLSKLYHVGEIRIGVIGLTHIKTPKECSKVSSLDFLEYKDIIIEESNKLKSQGAHSVILLAHFGPICHNAPNYEDKSKLKLRTVNDKQAPCSNFENIIDLLKSLPKGTIHALISGHIHEITHHYVNDIPVVASNGISYANVLYLTYTKHNNNNSDTYTLNTTYIEGPIPICSELFSNAKHCKHQIDFNPNEDIGELTTYSFHDVEVTPDPMVDEILFQWKTLMAPYLVPICFNEHVLERTSLGENDLHNLITDAFRKITHADIALVHVNGLRTKWLPGELNAIDIYNMFPFDNYVCSFTMNGREVLRMMNDITGNKFYAVSGLRVTYKRNPNVFVSAVMEDGSDIIMDKEYTIGSFDYLIYGNVEFKNVVTWYPQPRNFKKYMTGRHVMEMYLKELKVIKKGMFYNPMKPRNIFIN